MAFRHEAALPHAARRRNNAKQVPSGFTVLRLYCRNATAVERYLSSLFAFAFMPMFEFFTLIFASRPPIFARSALLPFAVVPSPLSFPADGRRLRERQISLVHARSFVASDAAFVQDIGSYASCCQHVCCRKQTRQTAETHMPRAPLQKFHAAIIFSRQPLFSNARARMVRAPAKCLSVFAGWQFFDFRRPP